MWKLVQHPTDCSMKTQATTPFSAPARKLALVAAVALVSTFGIVGPVSAQDTNNYKVAQGLGVYLGVLPAAMVKGYAPSRTEATMHGGVPAGPDEYHIVIAIYDNATGKRVENANVTITIWGTGHVGEHAVKLDPMAIAGTITYGAFVDFPGDDRYNLDVDIKVPGRRYPVDVDFANNELM